MILEENNNLKTFEENLTHFKSKFVKKDLSLRSRLNQYSSFRILIDLTSGIAVGGFIGYIIDDYLNTLPLMLFIFLIFGMIGGIYNCYRSMNTLENKEQD